MRTPKILTAIWLAAAGPAAAKGLTTLYTFTGGADGGNSYAGLLAGPGGSFFGTTTKNSGSVFQLMPPVSGQTAWTLATLYSFNGRDGAFPQSLVQGADGALYGMTDEGGIFNGVCASNGNDIGCGTVFRLAPPASGQTQWQLTTLWAFSGGADGSSPTGGVVFGPNGELYGFTYGGFTCPTGVCGGVYRLTPPASGQTAWTETTLYSFHGGRDGALAGSYGPPVLDPSGVIFGTTGSGGNITDASCAPYGCGTAFELTPTATGKTPWEKQTLLRFGGRNGIQPIGSLTEDAAGNLYGATNEGGRLKDCVPGNGYPNGCGVVFELSPPASGATEWTARALHKFTNGTDGAYPFGAPLAVNGRVFATTSGNEPASFGSLSELLPPAAGKSLWRERVRFVFTNDANSGNPTGTPLWRNGTLYGTTVGGGSGPAAFGTVYAYTP